MLHDKRQQRYRQALTGGQEAHLIAIACSPAPAGHDHWTVRGLSGKAVELGFVESISPETIRQLLKKTRLVPWQHAQWCIPEVSAEFVAPMEDVLDLYEETYDPLYPTVCFDEKLVAPEANVRTPEPMEPGRPERVDYEYERLGTTNLFFFVEPLSGWRHVEMTEHRTKLDYAHCIQWLVDEVYPHAEYIRIVQDNLNTHTAAAFYEAFSKAVARRILRRVEFHYTRHPWQLAQHGRDRDQYFCPWVFVAPCGKYAGLAPAHRHSGGGTQCEAVPHLVALYLH